MSTSKPERHAPAVGPLAAPPLTPDATHPQTVRSGLSRRTLLLGGAAAITAGVAAGASFGRGAAPAAAATARRTGTVRDVQHVVVLMQENRSFDHYHGTMPGVRGFSDKQALEFPGGGDVFHQPAPARTDGGVMLPFRLDTTKYNAQNAGGLDHSWSGGHTAWNGGAWDRWVDAKSAQTMGYFTDEDIPYQRALARAFTICDDYHCSVNGPTTPNRLYQWSATVNASGGLGGPATDNPADYEPVYRWGTYGERLSAAGVSWKTYANDEVGDSGSDPYVGDYGDNPLWLFQQYHDALASTDPARRALATQGGLHDGWKPNSGKGLDVGHLLGDFGRDCATNSLPTVSYVVAPYGWSEHPAASPDYGAHFTNAVVQALFSNPETWASTVLLVNYDENDGYFDHVVPPFPEPGTPDEYVEGLPVGLGARVPMTVVSPWSRGGWIDSQVADHTSVIRFLEHVTGVTEPNISTWRRTVSGDLLSCFDFTAPDTSVPGTDVVPDLTHTATLVAAADADAAKPPIEQPAPGAQVMPVQETGVVRRRPLPYRQRADVTVDRASGIVTVVMGNDGDQGVCHLVYPNTALPFAATPHTLAGGAEARWTWQTAATAGRYDVSVYGPDRFLRRFAGTVVAGSGTDVAVPHAQLDQIPGRTPRLRVVLENAGRPEVRFTVVANDFVTHRATARAGHGGRTAIDWPLDAWGYYDLVVTVDGDADFRYRFAGRVGGPRR
ncbi:phosphocholine-specific phospholipase C [Curtobacterium sp. VKM Ac-2922]|uniref:phosphocholine-specific phospholipase C n=1 Tax=Curtobacterium sp. VKM Ac-2922 TaxID=2929475 RepID=UPI001FB3F376|nr:phospholipase C, phosphocholine-specific [Curtobacterium sp. VKM Ac-2922]MCJ1714760.1 phospholipase C, phosphocholine-specific [Curtobacterium sp. VKM Ac-2922]